MLTEITPDTLIDFKDYNYLSRNPNKHNLARLAHFNELLHIYKEKAKQYNRSYYVEIEQCFYLISEYTNILFDGTPIQEYLALENFSYLYEHPYFTHAKETNIYYIFLYENQDGTHGEFQYIYIAIPKNENKEIMSNFKWIKNGEVERLWMKNRPKWFLDIYNRARGEVRKNLQK